MANSPAVTVKVIEPAPYLELLDPARITVKNVRRANPDQQFIESIRELGNFQPIGVLRTPDGELILRFGLQRLQACIETGRKVLAMVIDGTAGTSDADIERILLQLAENDRRRDLTAGERAGAVAELFALGADARTVGRRTGLGKSEIAAARKTAKSETARTLAAQYPLTLDQAAVIAEFDDTPELATDLAEVARDNPAQFAHAAEMARDERDEAAMIGARAAELTAQGYTVSSERPHYENMLSYWGAPDGKPLDPENHKDCPGSIVALQAHGYGESRRVSESWFCTDPQGNGHKKRSGNGQPAKDPEEAVAERKLVRENNTAWRAATTVRQRWLRDVLLARKDLPAGAALFIARAIAGAENHMINALTTMGGGRHKSARELLGNIEKDTYDQAKGGWTSPLVESIAGISEQRAHMISLALIVGAYEDLAADTDTWRHPSRAACEYFTALESWEYTLSPIEQGVVDAARTAKTPAAAAATAGEERPT